MGHVVHLDESRISVLNDVIRIDRKLVDNFCHESDVTSLQDLFTSCP